MENSKKLKSMIAGTLGVNENDITDDHVLRVGKFKTSAGSVILENMVKKVYGQKIDCKKAITFGDLINLVEGRGTNPSKESVSEERNEGVEIVAVDVEEVKEVQNQSRIPYFSPTGFVCGIDIQEVNIFPESPDYWSENFYTENFTDDEIAYCLTADSPRHSFAARWCLKEALHKCGKEYYDIPLKEIQVVAKKDGLLSIEIKTKDDKWQVLPFVCSLSHADNYAVGIVTGIK